jgi:hypothetical protein
MVERFHKPAQNVKIKATYVLIGIGIIGVAILAIKSSTTKSKEIRYLKDILTNNHETINSLTSRTAMLEYDLEQKVSIIESITYENKDLTVKLDKASNSNKA